MPETKTQDAASAASIDPNLVRELADVLNDTGLSEIEVERGDLRIRLTKSVPAAATPIVLPPQILSAAAPLAAPAPNAAAPPTTGSPAPPPPPAGDTVKSPMVGTVYMQAQPGAAPFARVGDRVDEGQTLLLVEAMKTMNPIAAPRAGVIVAFMVSDGQPVEYGEPLVVLG
jgi:acetyl-CoA carboxylase biotin carboxyl carrier protein